MLTHGFEVLSVIAAELERLNGKSQYLLQTNLNSNTLSDVIYTTGRLMTCPGLTPSHVALLLSDIVYTWRPSRLMIFEVGQEPRN